MASKISNGGKNIENKDNEPEIILLIMFLFAGSILLKSFFEKVYKILIEIYSTILFYKIKIALSLILIIIIVYITYKIYSKKKLKSRKIKERILEENRKVDEFLQLNLRDFNYLELKSKLRKIKETIPLNEYSELTDKIKGAKDILIELKHKEELDNLIDQKSSIKQEISKLEIEKNNLKRTDIDKKLSLKKNLNLEENYVFEKSSLNKEEINILLEENYKQVNEYCVFKKKIITVFVNPPLNHSTTHAFLVWSVRKLLEKHNIIENITEHETRDADLTFKIKRKNFAIEIETGSLLKKKNNLKNKINNLNLKYKNRWLIVVSNRNLLKKYSLFGPCTQRKWVEKEIEKMLKI